MLNEEGESVLGTCELLREPHERIEKACRDWEPLSPSKPESCGCGQYCKHDFLIDLINDPGFEKAASIVVELWGESGIVRHAWDEEIASTHVR